MGICGRGKKRVHFGKFEKVLEDNFQMLRDKDSIFRLDPTHFFAFGASTPTNEPETRHHGIGIALSLWLDRAETP